VREGEVFRVSCATNGLDDHIFVTISDPAKNPEKVLAANFTTWASYKDQSCIILPREYSELRNRSCVNFGDQGKVRVFSVAQYEEYIAKNTLRKLADLEPAILERLRAGRTKTKGMSEEVEEFLRAQGLLPPKEKRPSVS
jgi:hypothetical protein